MKQKLLALLLGLTLALSLTATASAVSQEHEVPVTLTIVNTEQRISVTVPAALPVSVIDGDVITATNAAIRNTAERGTIRVARVEVRPGAYAIGNYEDFQERLEAIALSLNGCPTRAAGELTISREAFPDIKAGEELAIDYRAVVNTDREVSAVKAAVVVFTIMAVE